MTHSMKSMCTDSRNRRATCPRRPPKH
jgi:hypothetical protein